ncbi:MAG TPA: hypothetical protein VFU41_08040 [Gemmatimonadales bacterium]|nr:hypothetical protein [Gemmatimonadales bacterium]
MRNGERRFTSLALATALALAIAGCGQDAAGPGQATLTQAEADLLAQAVTADVDAMLQGAGMSNSDAARLPAAPVELGDHPGAHCVPDRSPTPPQNSDADAVPDSVRLDFTGCVISTPRATITYSGTIDVIDPTPVDSDFAVKTVYNTFTRGQTRLISGNTTSATLNGTRSFLRNSSVLQHSEHDFRTDITFPDGSTAAHVKDWSSTFAADVAGSITRGPLPSGTWTITGSSTWTRSDRSYSLTVSTDPVLHYDASCTEAPRFDSGKLTVVVTRGDRTSTVTIEFTACGQYTVTRS